MKKKNDRSNSGIQHEPSPKEIFTEETTSPSEMSKMTTS
jgi:hypothetical protein